MGRRYIVLVLACVLVVLQSAGITIHRSFRSREVGFGGGVSASVPVDAKVAQALDAAAEKDAAKTKVIIGKCARVSDGDTIHVVTDGNVKYKVRLDRIDAPESDQPYGKESTAYLTKLIKGHTVRVEWQKKDQYGRVLGIVYLPNATLANEKGEADSCPLVKNDPSAKLDVNLTMVATGHAHHYSYFDKTPAYAAAEATAKAKKLGLWASDNISPYQWRKNKRRM